jgi:hypothetical protein
MPRKRDQVMLDVLRQQAAEQEREREGYREELRRLRAERDDPPSPQELMAQGYDDIDRDVERAKPKTHKEQRRARLRASREEGGDDGR